MTTNTDLANKVTTFTKFFYSIGDFGPSLTVTARTLFWLYFIVTIIGVDVGVAGIVFLVGRVWDAINDPLIGTWSDRFRSRWGRRRPFLLIGSIPFGIGFFLMFAPPPFEGNIAAAIYYSLIFIFYDTAYTFVSAPYTALTSELTEDYDERASLASWRTAASIFGAFISAALFKLIAESVFVGWFANELALAADSPTVLRYSYMLAGAIWGFFGALTPLFVVAFVREPERNYIQSADSEQTTSFNVVETLREVFANRPFMIGAMISLFTFTAVDMISAVFVWFLVYYMQIPAPFDSIVLAIVLGVAFLSMPLTIRLMHMWGKARMFIRMMTFWAVTMIIISFLPPGAQTATMVLAFFAGLGYGAGNAVPWAIIADVIEEDEWRTGKRQEGVYAGFLTLTRKASAAIAVGILVPQVLSWAGFVEGAAAAQPESAQFALRMFMGAVPALLLVLSMIAAAYYPLNREAHGELRRKLAERRAGN
ncbi:MAG: glycoside-pentoside-hexuronide (GPH):cation symporter [Chloroflexota bacterium]